MDLNFEDFRDWSPIRVYETGGRVFVDWCFVGRDRFVAPFHDDTIEIHLREPFNLLFRRQTPIEFLGEIYEHRRGIAPTGFIFHVSRCGSTLVSQMLASVEKNVVISEASVIDKILRADAFFQDVSMEQKIIWLRWLLNAMAQKRFDDEEHFFVKFDSWSVINLSLIEKAFPETPWVFMYRNPVEVIVSNLRQPGMQMIPGAIEAIFPKMNLMEILRFPTEERFARTVAAFCEAALKHASSPNGKFINYNQLPEAVESEICRHFGVAFSDEEINRMRQSSKFHAKSPREEFKPDGAEKRKEASETVIRLAEKFASPLYEQLEKARLQNTI